MFKKKEKKEKDENKKRVDSKTFTLAGVLTDIDKYDRATILFPCTYDKDGKDAYGTEARLEELDKQPGYSPVERGQYKVKVQKDTFAYLNGNQCILKELIGHKVLVEVSTLTYDYPGKKGQGWYLKLHSMRNTL